MKKVVLILLVAILASQLKAKQLPSKQFPALPKSNLTLDTNLFFKPLKGSQFFLPKLDNQQVLAQLQPLTNGANFYSKMPVLKTNSNVDRMPVIIPGKPGEKYPMLIKKIDIITQDSSGIVQLTP